MPDDYTTIRLTKSTRSLINKIAKEKKVSVEQLLLLFTKSTKDSIKQILLDVDREKYYAVRELTRILYGMKLISSPKVEDAFMLAIDNLMKGMEKQLQSTQTPQPSPMTEVFHQ